MSSKYIDDFTRKEKRKESNVFANSSSKVNSNDFFDRRAKNHLSVKKRKEMLLSCAYLIAKDNLKLNITESIKLLVTVLDELSGSLAASFSSPARYRQVAIRVSFNYVPETWQLA